MANRFNLGNVGRWLMRFGPAEIIGLVASYAGWQAASQWLPGTPVVAAYGAALGENIGYYAVIFVRDWLAMARPDRSAKEALSALVYDFGLAEIFDTALLRPVATVLAVALLGQAWGVGAGKLAADILFYVLAITFYERRRAREFRR